MQVRELDTTNTKDVDKFIQFPFDLYKGSEFWVPHFVTEIKTVMNRQKHPFYEHSDAAFLLAESEGVPVGRIAILHHRNYSEFHKAQYGFFYYFDAIDDIQVSRALFEAAIDWARKRGIEYILGPKGFARSSGIGLLIEGFDYLPAVGMNYNYPYYQKLVEDAGFTKWTDHLSGFISRDKQVDPRIHEAAKKVMKRNDFRVLSFKNKKEMKAMIPAINTVNREAFQGNPGYYPSTPAEFNMLAKNMIQILDPELPKLIMKGDEVAGFIIAYRNVSRGIQRSKGKMWPFGWIELLKDKKQTRLIDMNGVGLLPKYQGLGANALLYSELEKTLRATNADIAEFVQIDELNFRSKSDMERVGVTWRKRHRTYQLSLK
jgi:GNAT superfamily N-acetyltransferase